MGGLAGVESAVSRTAGPIAAGGGRICAAGRGCAVDRISGASGVLKRSVRSAAWRFSWSFVVSLGLGLWPASVEMIVAVAHRGRGAGRLYRCGGGRGVGLAIMSLSPPVHAGVCTL